MTLVELSLENHRSTLYLIELSSLSITVPELYDEMCTARLFYRGSTSLYSNFTWTGSSPSTVLGLGIRKLETPGYPTVKTASLGISSF